MDYDGLWERPAGGNMPWVDTISNTAKQELEKLADLIVAREGREPNWSRVQTEFEKSYPLETPKTRTTIRDTVRRMVKAR